MLAVAAPGTFPSLRLSCICDPENSPSFEIINAKILDNCIQEELGLLAEWWHIRATINFVEVSAAN